MPRHAPLGWPPRCLDQLAEALEVAFDASFGKPDCGTDEFGDALGLEGHLDLDTRCVVAERLEADDAVIALSADGLPRDPLVGHLLGDLRVPVAYLPGDLAPPVQADVIELLHLLDATHEGGELLELRPLVIGRPYRHVDDGALADGRALSRLSRAQDIRRAGHRDGDERDLRKPRHCAAPVGPRDLLQELSALARREVTSDVGRADDADQAVSVDHRQPANLRTFHSRQRLANRVVGADRHRLALG